MQHTLPAPGARLWIRQRSWRLERVRIDPESAPPRVTYLEVTAGDGHRGPHTRLTFLAPFDRPAHLRASTRPKRVKPTRALARLAGLLATRPCAPGIGAALDAHVDILPHQLEPALAAAQGRRRILIADEVGLGKTIQAGLIVADLCRRHPLARVLLVVPASLRAQWLDELSRRFGLIALPADRAGLEAAEQRGARGDNPWDRGGVWIASIDYLKQPHVRAGIPGRPWDLIVIDEAHDVCGDSERHDASHDLACRSRQTVLLTATPHSGDDARFRRLIGLGHLPALDGDDLTIFRRRRLDLRWSTDRRERWVRIRPSANEHRLLDSLEAFGRAVGATRRATPHESSQLLVVVFQKRALSTSFALQRSLQRRMAWLDHIRGGHAAEAWQPHLAFGEDDGEMAGEEERAMTGASALPEGQERAWIGRLRLLAAAAARDERKVRWLERAIARSGEPVVVFTEYRDSLEMAAERLAAGHRVATLHGGQSPDARREALAAFLEGRADVLVTTDVGGQGLNLQTRARWVVSLDLPWRPYRLEQRLGRCDRIGQTKSVHGTRLTSAHPMAAALETRLASQQVAAAQAIGDLPSNLPLPACRRWTRSARVLARALVTRRRWLSHLRHHEEGHRRPWRSSWAGWTRAEPLQVFSVPILDDAGLVIEHSAVGVVGAGDARSFVEARAAPRARVLTKRARARAVRDEAVQAAMDAYVLERLPRDGRQLGLFHARGEPWMDTVRAAHLEGPRGHHCQCTVRAGEPVLVLTLESRRRPGSPR